jgi:hypothetical protein
VLTTAGDPSHFSARILAGAQASALWHVHEVPGPSPWMSEERLAEQRTRLTESSYARLFENRWTEPEDRLTTVDDLRACSTLTDWPLGPEPDGAYLLTVDIGLKNDRTVVSVTHVEPREGGTYKVVLDRMAVWQGSRTEPVSLEAVEAWILSAALEYDASGILVDPYQAAQLVQRLRARGLRVDEYAFTASSVGRLGQGLYLALRDHALALPSADHDDPGAAALHDELAAVRLKESSPGVYRLDHDSGRHDDRAIALALAVWWWRERVVAVDDGWGDEDEAGYQRDLVRIGPQV